MTCSGQSWSGAVDLFHTLTTISVGVPEQPWKEWRPRLLFRRRVQLNRKCYPTFEPTCFLDIDKTEISQHALWKKHDIGKPTVSSIRSKIYKKPWASKQYGQGLSLYESAPWWKHSLRTHLNPSSVPVCHHQDMECSNPLASAPDGPWRYGSYSVGYTHNGCMSVVWLGWLLQRVNEQLCLCFTFPDSEPILTTGLV